MILLFLLMLFIVLLAIIDDNIFTSELKILIAFAFMLLGFMALGAYAYAMALTCFIGVAGMGYSLWIER